ncbi:MAG TPA: hypothetical protein VK698_38525 [Kofleriaceae bacterium]|nr:hypothetical protein [Kofleriaceae bacterium]
MTRKWTAAGRLSFLIACSALPASLGCGGDDDGADSDPDAAATTADAAAPGADAAQADAAPSSCPTAIATLGASRPFGQWMAVDRNHVYWIDAEGASIEEDTGASVRRVARGGGEVEVLSEPSAEVRPSDQIIVDETHIYLFSEGSLAARYSPVRRMPLGGGALENVTGPADGSERPVFSLVMDQTHVYWTEGPEILRYSKESGVGEDFQGMSQFLSSPVALDETSIYWEESGLDGQIWRRSKEGPNDISLAANLPAGFGNDRMSGLVVAAGGFYYAALDVEARPSLVHVTATGESSEVIASDGTSDSGDTVLAPGGRMVLLGGDLYWSRGSALWRMALAGGDVQNLALVGPVDGFNFPFGLGESSFFFPQDGQLFEEPLAGCDQDARSDPSRDGSDIEDELRVHVSGEISLPDAP